MLGGIKGYLISLKMTRNTGVLAHINQSESGPIEFFSHNELLVIGTL